MENFFENIQNMNPTVLEYVINALILNDDIINDHNENDENNSNQSTSDENDESNEANEANENNESNNKLQTTPFSYGCKHYLRRCKIISPCCNEIYSCRLCHDEEKYDLTHDDKIKHKLDRFKINEIVCNTCNKKQQVKQYCEQCQTCFGLYYCDICHLFDDIDKNQFHCDGCGFCRIGGKDKFVHCNKCNMCIVKDIYESHKCLNILDSLCPICMSDMFTSTVAVIQMKCGHYIHNKCFYELLNESYKCPMCSASIIETSELNQIIENEVNATEMPDEYKNLMLNILCNDCHKESAVKFHIVGLKCQHCGGYNTRKV